jgi:ribose-phosphate pyrophosphokinase
MSYKIFSLSQSKELGKEISDKLGIKQGDITLDVFSDGEMSPSFQESVRGHSIYIIGSLHQPHDNFMEMLLTIDAAKRAGAYKVNLVVPYYAYARQDKKDKSRGSIGARVIANALKANGMDSILIVDLHAAQIEGFFNYDSPVIHISGKDIFIPYFKNIVDESWMICSPDAGGVPRAKRFADNLKLDLVVINKRRDKPNSIGSMELVGDVKGRKVLITDDMIDTAGSLVKACELLLENGATEVSACITHGVLSGEAYERIEKSNLKNLYISDTIPVKNFNQNGFPLPSKIVVISCSKVISRVISAVNDKVSIERQLREIE